MFLHLSVSHSVHRGAGCYSSMHCKWHHSMPCSRSSGGGVVSQHAQGVSRPTPGVGSPGPHQGEGGSPGPHPEWGVSQHALRQTPLDGYCCGRYPSYWNEFLWDALKIIYFSQETTENPLSHHIKQKVTANYSSVYLNCQCCLHPCCLRKFHCKT